MHEPSDVTIELDGLGRQLSELPAGIGPVLESGPDGEFVQEGSDKPVFVDASGRRGKKFRRAGWIVAIACACYAVTLVAALIGGSSNAPWLNLPLPGRADNKPKTVEVLPGPSNSASVGVAPGGTAPGPAPTDSNGNVLPRPSGSATAGADNSPEPGDSDDGQPAKPPKGGDTGSPGGGNTNPVVPPPVTSDPPGDTGGTSEPPPDVPSDPPVGPSTPASEPAGDPSANGAGTQLAAEGGR
jgi:hypothetical protein